MTHIQTSPASQQRMSKKYSAMSTVENANFSSIYTPEIYFDDWTPCINLAWNRLYNEKTRTLQPEWAHLNSTTTSYFLLQIPERAIHGLLFIDNGKVFFRDHYKSRLSQARIRNSLKGMNIFGAFWVPHQQRLILHDIYMHESQSLCEEVFTNRWESLAKSLAHIENDESMQGFTLSIAAGTINENAGEQFCKKSMNEASNNATSMILQPNMGLAVVIHSIPVGIEKAVNIIGNKMCDDKIEDCVYITKHTKFNGPESFQIWSAIDNKDLGMPCIQSLKMIQDIRARLKETDKCLVNIKWNKHLNSYEVVSIK